MKKIFIYLSNSHENILKGLIILVALWLIATMLPHKVRYKFDIKKGKVWNDEDLIAPFDFAIYKDPDSLKQQRNDLAESVLPHFTVDTTIAPRVIAEFERRVTADTIAENSRTRFVNEGTQVLNEIYGRGVIRISESERPGENGRIVLVSGKYTTTRFADEFLSPRNVAEFITQKISTGDQESNSWLIAFINSVVTPDIFYDETLTNQVKDQLRNSVSPTRGMIHKDEIIISRGQLISGETYLVLESLKKATESSDPDSKTSVEIFWSQVVVIAIALSMLLMFLALLRKDIFADNRKITLIFSLIVMIVAAYTGIMKLQSLSAFVVPVCILPVVIRVFFDTRLALFTHVITILILGSVAPNGYEFVFIQVIAGMVTIFSVTNLRKRAQLFISAGMILISYVVTYLALAVIHEGSFVSIEISNIYWLTGNVLLTLFAYPMIYIFEKVFGLTSDISLMELSDTNSPLLRELSIKAPGTFQHSMQVANLAEAATFKIGGNTLLVRAGALYHDIGKMEMPMYFIENQSTGVNPHDELSFDESAAIIISHVIKGIEKARKNKVPDLIVDFIRTHHGTSMVQYFYQSFLKNFPEEMVDEDDFRYPGPLPFSKETAVLMMADSVEAASRSLINPNSDSINNLVDSIIDNQIEQQQFVNCDITFKDISSVKKIFKRMLMSIYHVRVEYPAA